MSLVTAGLLDKALMEQFTRMVACRRLDARCHESGRSAPDRRAIVGAHVMPRRQPREARKRRLADFITITASACRAAAGLPAKRYGDNFFALGATGGFRLAEAIAIRAIEKCRDIDAGP